MSMIETLRPVRSTVRFESSQSGDAHWLHMHADADNGVRPCFRPALMREMHACLDTLCRTQPAQPRQIRSLVLASDADAFNLGGDLEVFAALIRRDDHQALFDYARSCVDGVHRFHEGLDGSFRTIALLQGDALGGGLEMALACHTIVAEEDVNMGLPEVLFGLFPGMGAYSYLTRRVSPQLAEKLILEGRVYSSQEMHAMGIVDVLVPRGEGEDAVRELVRQQQRAPTAYRAMNAVRRLSSPVSYEELIDITRVWVDTALLLEEKQLRVMDRLVKAQARRATRQSA
jgi:DSF synthase